MNLLREIFEWIKTLPGWQQDAARRLYDKPSGLSDVDYQELFCLALKENGLLPAEKINPMPMDVSRLQDDVVKHSLILKSIGNLRHVNKIDPSQTIPFSRTGITIVYGNNGSGKSGYARVFKRACFCRDSGERVLPDVENVAECNALAAATFEVEYDGVSKKIDWVDGHVNPELSYISVFDSKSARIVLDSEQEPRYIPYGLDVLTTLGATVLPKIKQEIENKWKALDLSENCFADLKGDTEVGKVFSNLLCANRENIRVLGAWTPKDLERGQYLKKFLSDNNYKARISANTFILGRLSMYYRAMSESVARLDENAVQHCAQAFQRWHTAKEAEKIAVQDLRNGEELMQGTGDDAWKLMFQKAQEFVAGFSEHDSRINITDCEKCPLCQQEMDGNARARIKRFAEYVADKVAVEVKESIKEVEATCQAVMTASADVILGQANLQEIEQLAQGATTLYRQFTTTFEQRKAEIIKALRGNRGWESFPAVDIRIVDLVLQLKNRLEKENADLHRAVEDNNIAALEKEREELRARYRLSQKMNLVEQWFDRKDLRDSLRKASHDITTLNITNKIKELSEVAISDPLRLAVEKEFVALGIANMRLRPALVPKGRKGRLVTAFELGVANRQPLGAVLSEGEQKAIAIASFMAELSISGHKQAVVFDDPMTSLDHMRRRKVAIRLSKEAKTRQVIVFSHEPVFVTLLEKMCSDEGVACSILSLGWNGGTCGFVSEGMPWEHKKYTDRIQELKQIQKRLSGVVGAYPSEEQSADIRRFYGRLRATIELVAQEVCLQGAVRRFSDEIKMAKLAEISPLDTKAVRELYSLFGKCSDIFEGHDHASAANESVPFPLEMREDIDSLESAVATIRLARKKPPVG